MVKKIFSFFKKIVVAGLLIYAYDRLALPLGVTIPINLVTLLLVAILEIPSMFALICFFALFY